MLRLIKFFFVMFFIIIFIAFSGGFGAFFASSIRYRIYRAIHRGF